MNSITLKSHAKVNIGLRVLDQREDGYHNIHTIFQELAFHDTVTISKTDDDYELSSNDVNFPKDSSNTCSKAYVAVKVHYPDVAGIKMQGIGIGERAERLLVIAIIGMIGFMEIAVIIVIIIATITLAQRISVLVKSR